MRSKVIALAAAAVLLMGFLAGCNKGPQGEPYPGANDIPYSLGDMFTINIVDDTENGRYKYAVCTVVIEIGDPTWAATFDARRARLRSIVDFTIGSKTVSQLNTEEQKKDVLQEIVDAINGEFDTDIVHRADFGDFYFHT